MKKFTRDLFSNRFGIVLATLNLCYFMSKGVGMLNYPAGKLFACANLPAIASTALSLEFIKIFWHGLKFRTEYLLGDTFFVLFIVLQWLCIAWLAKTIAGKLRPREI